MATLIPALGACVSRMTHGERRLGELRADEENRYHCAPSVAQSQLPVGTDWATETLTPPATRSRS